MCLLRIPSEQLFKICSFFLCIMKQQNLRTSGEVKVQLHSALSRQFVELSDQGSCLDFSTGGTLSLTLRSVIPVVYVKISMWEGSQ